MKSPQYRDVSLLALMLLLATAFTFTGAGSDGFISGEAVTATNMNEIDTALDTLEATDTTIAAIPFWTAASTSALSGEKNLGALATGLVINTAGVPSAYAGATATANTVVTAFSASGAVTSTALTSAYLPSTATLDADTTVECTTRQFFSPQGGELLAIYGKPFATTLVRYRAYVLPATSVNTVTIRLEDCGAGGHSCGFADAALTASNGTPTWDTAFTDSVIDADDSVLGLVGAPSGNMNAESLVVETCYSSTVVK